jgi:hypothetical protein
VSVSRTLSVCVSLIGAVLLSAALPGSAVAGGLYLKLAAEKPEVRADEPVALRLTATATRTFDLPATPVLLVDDGSGMQPRSEFQCNGLTSAASRITPDRSWAGSCEISFPKPGGYQVRMRYRLADQIVETNKVSVKVLAAGPKTAQE